MRDLMCMYWAEVLCNVLFSLCDMSQRSINGIVSLIYLNNLDYIVLLV